MRISIDIRTINKPKSGVGYYVTNLIDELQSIDRDNQYCLISNDPNPQLAALQRPNFNHCHTVISNENHLVGDVWENTLLPRFLKKEGTDIFHGPAFMIPLINKGPVKTVATIHDIVSFVMPGTIPRKYGLYMRALIRLVNRSADKIITDSESTKNDLMRWLATPEEKICVVPLAVSHHFKPAATDSFAADKKKFTQRLGIRDRYVLFVGNLEPRKNLTRLMRAFSETKKKGGDDCQLVICGKKGWLYEEILQTHQRYGQNGDIILTDYVTEEDLLRLYQYTDLFAFPTLYEGFGLPVLEAMACGAPVMTSDISSLPEISGSAAALVDPCDEQQITETMLNLLGDNALCADMRARGLEQAACFSWRNTAAATLEVYRSCHQAR